MRIILSQEQLQKMGSKSLMGFVAGDPEDKDIVLEFPQTSTQWRRENEGPDLWITPEYTMMCIVQDVVTLVTNGYKITVKESIIGTH